ncbi:SAG-related sequence SRS29C [Besnoitia besnoiti]|uniref:SAG-related sequence SRS29C n=1 Tax=Besnoitia besnoiti TaxID=94643 RepID=A0A2A9MIW7_BESBE|nr:SAG-related sequence SRS29C [Besnoitia besnoiti]PFH38488.1 SAG-related sequence SRS29C [Besnoitia besnoiti]
MVSLWIGFVSYLPEGECWAPRYNWLAREGRFTCYPNVGETDEFLALSYGEVQHITLVCADGTPVPSNLVTAGNRQVCAGRLSAADCQKGAAPLAKFVYGAQDDWFTGTDSRTGVTITIPDKYFPVAGEEFSIGCKGIYTCMLTVFLQLRSPRYEIQEAGCSYNANKRLPQIVMNQDKNVLTVMCRPDGEMFPPDYKDKHCTETPFGPCLERRYSEVLPRYNETWWSGDPSSMEGASLTIPKDSFPKTTQHFTVVCIGPRPHPRNKCVVPIEVSAPSEPGQGSVTDVSRGGGEHIGGTSGSHKVSTHQLSAVMSGLLTTGYFCLF